MNKKVADWESFKQEVKDLGMEIKELEDPDRLKPTPELLKMFEKPTDHFTRFFKFPSQPSRHLMIGAVSVIALCAISVAATLFRGGRLVGRQ